MLAHVVQVNLVTPGWDRGGLEQKQMKVPAKGVRSFCSSAALDYPGPRVLGWCWEAQELQQQRQAAVCPLQGPVPSANGGGLTYGLGSLGHQG